MSIKLDSSRGLLPLLLSTVLATPGNPVDGLKAPGIAESVGEQGFAEHVDPGQQVNLNTILARSTRYRHAVDRALALGVQFKIHPMIFVDRGETEVPVYLELVSSLNERATSSERDLVKVRAITRGAPAPTLEREVLNIETGVGTHVDGFLTTSPFELQVQRPSSSCVAIALYCLADPDPVVLVGEYSEGEEGARAATLAIRKALSKYLTTHGKVGTAYPNDRLISLFSKNP